MRAIIMLALLRRTSTYAPRTSFRFRTTRSAAEQADDALVAAGAAERRRRLDEELTNLGFDADRLERDAALRGSAALATYRRFVIPKTAKGLSDALAPARAASVAVDVAGLARKHLAEQADWLRNRDRALDERPPPPHVDLVVVLDGLRSGENVGSVLRTVETAGAGRVICCGTTPAPPTPAVLRAAMGCADLVEVEEAPSTLETVLHLKRDGYAVWACETTARSARLFDTAPPRPLALVFGHEEFGVSVDVMEACDAVVEIPVCGLKNSLNVANAVAVVLFDVVRRWSNN
jgi:tRNA G18 (ribose-2'-O)-methylase SpoU